MSVSDMELPSNRKFGFFFAIVFVLFGIYFIFERLNTTAYVFLVFAAGFLVVSFAKADVLLPLNKMWMRLGLLLGKIISPIVLAIIFFGLFTPISLLMRLYGRDELHLKPSNKASYWKQRVEDMSNDAFKRQF